MVRWLMQPEPRITITEANRNAASNGIYNEDVRLHISVEDPVNGGTYSGIERIWYDVHSTGNERTALKESWQIIRLTEFRDTAHGAEISPLMRIS